MDLPISIEELSLFIGDIYNATLTEQWDDVLAKLMDYTQSNKAFFFLHNHLTATPLTMNVKANFDLPLDALAQYQQRATEDPGYELTRFMSEGEWMNINKHMDIQVHRGTSFYTEIYQPLKVHHAMAGVLCRDNEHDSFCVINRSEEDKPYSTQEENLFALITPHFSRAMRIYKSLRLHKHYSNLTKSILDQEDKSIVVCTVDGRVLISNAHAQRTLTLPNALYIADNRLKVQQPVFHQQLYRYIEQCSQLAYHDIALQETLLVEEEGHDDMLIYVAPLLKQNQFTELDVPCCLVTVNTIHKTNWQNVQREFCYTDKELTLAKAICSKQKLNDIAREYSVSYNTLRNRLQSVFKKTGVNSQTALLSRLSIF